MGLGGKVGEVIIKVTKHQECLSSERGECMGRDNPLVITHEHAVYNCQKKPSLFPFCREETLSWKAGKFLGEAEDLVTICHVCAFPHQFARQNLEGGAWERLLSISSAASRPGD